MIEMLILFAAFFKVGTFAFGGGTAMLPLIYQSVQSFGTMSADQFSDMVALSQVTPGPVAVNAATYVGLDYGGVFGAIIATLGVCIPCFIIMIIVMKLLERFKDSRYVQGAFAGIRPVTIGLIAAAAIFIADGVLTKGPLISSQLTDVAYYNWMPIGIFILSVALMSFGKLKPIWIMLIMAAAGSMIYGFAFTIT